MQFFKSLILSLLKAIVYIAAWTCELSGKVLVTISDSLFKISK